MFKKYQHLERLGTSSTDGILDGKVFVFRKIDGTNASIWYEDLGNNIFGVSYGSRNRQLYELYLLRREIREKKEEIRALRDQADMLELDVMDLEEELYELEKSFYA